jgi:Bacterial RNA polymerase, alpha chain C terminal domain
MPTISRFVIWERPPDFTKINPALASLLRETRIESLDMVHGQEPSHLGRNAQEIKHLLERSNLGMLAHAWWPPREATPDSLLDQSVDVLELNARSTNCLLAAGIRTIRDLRQQGYLDLRRLKNMGRKSLREILEKLAAFRYKEDPPPPEIHPDQSWFPLAAAGSHNDTTKDSLVDQSVEVLKLSGRLTRCLLKAGIGSIRDLLQQGNKDLLRIKGLDLVSLWDIRERLATFQLEHKTPVPENHPHPCWFPLAAIASYEVLGLPSKTRTILRRAGIKDVHELLFRTPSEFREAFGVNLRSWWKLHAQLACFRLFLGTPPPPFVTAHLGSIRSAFGANVERYLSPADQILGAAFAEAQTAAASCLEEELELSVREERRERHLPIIRRFLGWDGSPGTTLKQTAHDFRLTRERVRQIVGQSISRYASEKAVLFRRAIGIVAARAPTMAQEVEAALVREGITRTPFRLESMLATARWFEIEPGWKVHNRNGVRFVAKVGDQSIWGHKVFGPT